MCGVMKLNNTNITYFKKDVKKGYLGEDIFEKDFLKHTKLEYHDVSRDSIYRLLGVDFISKTDKYEVEKDWKTNVYLYKKLCTWEIKANWEQDNKVSEYKGKMWQSAFRRIPISEFSNYYIIVQYDKIQNKLIYEKLIKR